VSIRKIVKEQVEFNINFVSKGKLKTQQNWNGLCIHCKESSDIKEYQLRNFDRICVSCRSEKLKVKYLIDKERCKTKAQVRWEKYGKSKINYYANRRACYAKSDKIKQRTVCDYTKEELQAIMSLPCSYCTYPSTGIDRINNAEGHTKINTIPCCFHCNTARMDNFSVEEMKLLGKVIKEIKDKRKL
jgi:hypothetical protein